MKTTSFPMNAKERMMFMRGCARPKGVNVFIVVALTFALVLITACDQEESVCGNNILEASEQCDDGNTVDGDGCSASCSSETPTPSEFIDIPLKSEITKVQPMTGIVLWADSHTGTAYKTGDDVIQLEYAYMRPSDIVTGENQYDWAALENLLEDIRSRKKQAIIRWYYVYPGNIQTAVPDYIKDYTDYEETIELSEGQDTAFPDWSHPELQQAHLDFYRAFAERYDHDPRIAFLQVGFGLWGEYHIYDPGIQDGANYPTHAFQKEFLERLAGDLTDLKWSISIDAGDIQNSPISGDEALLSLPCGNFDDSFMHAAHGDYNESMWEVFGYQTRYRTAPHGGELSYYSDYDQRHALDAAGMYGRTYENMSEKFHITYMIGADQPEYQSIERIKAAGMASGYKFTVDKFRASSSQTQITIRNTGVAPIYYDAYPTINGVRAGTSLKGLAPNESLDFTIEAGGEDPTLTIECDRLVEGQKLEYEADL
jgi:cysteine-rich repeat protein